MITLVLAFHNHQPVGNFEWVIEDAYKRAYLPLMTTLAAYPTIHFAQHYTGILLDWFATRHPEFIDRIGACVARGNLELLSGGYYEPILSMLPERDRHAQIVRLNRRISDQFGVRPRGMWLAERVWEPSLPSTLHDASIDYTILDDTHFKAAGLQEQDLSGYFMTEDQGKPLAVFPIDKRLRYTMPFEAPAVTIDYLKSLDSADVNRVVVFADDGEKFGVWPDTWRTVYGQGWLRDFCALVEANGAWLRTAAPGDVMATTQPTGRIYLPTASYAEMLHWALPTPEAFSEFEAFEHLLKEETLLDRFDRFVRGGFWRNFMVKYPEINAMHKKMLRVSERLVRVWRAHGGNDGATAALEQATAHLLAAQCNCPYWHGVFGGIYLANIRMALYREMISAERLLDGVEGVSEGRVTAVDYDLDGSTELLYESAHASIYLAPAVGGAIFEFDYKPARHNFIDLLHRRREGYHTRLLSLDDAAPTDAASGEEARSIHDIVRTKESGLEKALRYDTYRHGLFVDHLLDTLPGAEDLRAASLPETYWLAHVPYAVSWSCNAGIATFTLRHEFEAKVGSRAMVEKIITVDEASAGIHVSYVVRALDATPLSGYFGIEMAYALSAGTEPDRYYEFNGRRPAASAALLNSTGMVSGTDFALVDEWLGVKVRVAFERTATIIRAPIETVSLSEDGFERNYQGSVLLAAWDISGLHEWRMEVGQRVEMTTAAPPNNVQRAD